MEFLKSALAALGGGAVVFGASIVAARYFLYAHLDKRMVILKAAIASENAVALEKLKVELAREVKSEERSYEYAQVMSRYQGPLQHAIYDLQSRL